jgi:hypothetical protein
MTEVGRLRQLMCVSQMSAPAAERSFIAVKRQTAPGPERTLRPPGSALINDRGLH